MMQLHPRRNELADCVFQRMPPEGFLDAKKVLMPDNGPSYDSLLDIGSCERILNKFEKNDEILRPLRKEYERVTGTIPALSGICEILNRLQEINFNEKMKSKNNVEINLEQYRCQFAFDYSADFLVTNVTLKGVGVPVKREKNKIYLFVYFLDRQDKNIVKPKFIKTITAIQAARPIRIGYGGHLDFRVSGSILAVYIGYFEEHRTISVDFYDLNPRSDNQSLIYSIDNIAGVAWCNSVLIKYPIHPVMTRENKNEIMFFSDGYFVILRRNEEKNFIEIHEISSNKCTMVKKIETIGFHRVPFYHSLYIERIGRSTWNILYDTERTPHVIFVNMMRNIIAESKKHWMENMGRFVKNFKEKNPKRFGHVRLFEDFLPNGVWEKNYLKFYA